MNFRNILNFILCVVVSSLISLPAFGVTTYTPVAKTSAPQMANFERQFAALMRKWRIPGAAVAVMKNNQLIYSQGFGYANLDSRQPTSTNNLFRIASISKTLTAVAILQLAQQGKLSLDTPVFKILNDVDPLPGLRENPAINKITIRNLLVMSSGWADSGPRTFDPLFGPWPLSVANRLGETPSDCMKTLRLMMGMPLQFAPGKGYAYSNLNYCTLGLVIEKVTGGNYNPQNYERYVQNQILTPSGITDMRLAKTSLSEQAPNEVRYYPYYMQPEKSLQVSGLPYSQSRILEKNYADAGWLATAEDLVKFGQAIIDHRLINANMINEMIAIPSYVRRKTDLKSYFAMGWSVKTLNNQRSWEKTGSFTGSNALLIKAPDNTIYALMFNTKPEGGQIRRFRNEFKQLVMRINKQVA